MEGFGRVAANGLIIVYLDRAVMIDTPWTPEQTSVLLDWVDNQLKARVTEVVVSHSHVDCLGGLPEVHRRGIRSIGLDKTRELALAAGAEPPEQSFQQPGPHQGRAAPAGTLLSRPRSYGRQHRHLDRR